LSQHPRRKAAQYTFFSGSGAGSLGAHSSVRAEQESLAMKFGIHNSSWLDAPDPAEAFEAVKAKAQWAENCGFVWFSIMDHMIQIPRVSPPDEPILEGWTVLAALAAVTSRIRLATLCTAVGYRNPAHLAKIAASVDLISRGRLTLGIGAGIFEDEYRQYGWEFPPLPATRIRQMEEAVQVILKMWTEKRTTFHGRYFQVEGAILEPKPAQKPRPPVMIAGSGEQMTLRAVARLADACNIVDGDVAEIRHKFDVLRRHCDAVGRDYDTIEKTRIQPWLLGRNDAAVAAKRERLAARGPLRGFVGTVFEAIDLIGQYQDAGVDLMINAHRQNDAETRELFASDVMPHFG
jgi:F420-dependent oxidoreductase-like protein